MIEVGNLLVVLGVTVGIAATVGVLYAFGLRLWAAGQLDSSGNAHLLTRLGSVACFACCVCVILFALYLMIPIFH